MSEIPAKALQKRRELSCAFLSGDGIEVGALHHPLALGPRARVRYVDRLDVEGLRHHYPELRGHKLVSVDVIDDGERLSTFQDGELDFLIANHFLEHTENPIGTIRNHLRKLRPGGRLYFSVPNKHGCFDRDREPTPFEHLVVDDREGPERSRADHYREWAARVEKREEAADLEARANQLMEMKYSIHFHVWDARSFGDFLEQTRSYLDGAFDIEHFSVNGSEIIAILGKRDPSSARRGVGLRREWARLSRRLSSLWADCAAEARNHRAALGRSLRRRNRRRSA